MDVRCRKQTAPAAQTACKLAVSSNWRLFYCSDFEEDRKNSLNKPRWCPPWCPKMPSNAKIAAPKDAKFAEKNDDLRKFPDRPRDF
jgi:hypothetical protein